MTKVAAKPLTAIAALSMETAHALVGASVARPKVNASAPTRHPPAAARLNVAALTVSARLSTQLASVVRHRAPVCARRWHDCVLGL